MTKNETKTFIQLQQYNKAVYYTKKLCSVVMVIEIGTGTAVF